MATSVDRIHYLLGAPWIGLGTFALLTVVAILPGGRLKPHEIQLPRGGPWTVFVRLKPCGLRASELGHRLPKW